jgi:hypothetical protein
LRRWVLRKCCKCNSKKGTIKEGSKREKTVVVLLGDSSKPDPVKPYGIFDEDDIEVIAELEKALRDLKGYEFISLKITITSYKPLKNLRLKRI